MVVEILATVLGVLSVVAAAATLRERARSSRGAPATDLPGALDAIVESAPGVPVSPTLLRTLAVASPSGGVRILLASPPGDASVGAAVEAARRGLPGLDASVRVEVPPARAVAGTWLAGRILAEERSDPCLLADARVVAAARDVGRLVQATRDTDLALATPCATPGPWARTFLSPGAVSAAVAPIAHVLFGPAGVLPGLGALRGAVRRASLADPLFVHRPSALAAVALHVPAARARLVPVSACIPDDRGTRAWVAGHLAVLVRTDRVRALLLTLIAAALPAVVLLCVAAPAHASRRFLVAVLAAVFASRAATALAWSASGNPPLATFLDLALAPVRDLWVTFRLVRAWLSSRVRSGSATYRAMNGGTLLSVESRGDEPGGP